MTQNDNRGTQRKRVLKGATIIFNSRSSTISCAVRDVSDTGARLRVPAGQIVPDQFDLLIDVDGFEAPCSVAWRRGDEIGVKFTGPPTTTSSRRPQVITAVTRTGQAPSLRRKPPG